MDCFLVFVNYKMSKILIVNINYALRFFYSIECGNIAENKVV